MRRRLLRTNRRVIVLQAAAAGHYVSGLMLDAAHWDTELQCLCAAQSLTSSPRLPILQLLPCADVPDDAATYDCPLFRTAARAGALTTTGHSTNFIMHLALPVTPGSNPADWTLRGAAALCCSGD